MSSIKWSGIGLFVILSISFGTAQAQNIIYVDDDAALGGDGTSWEGAYKYLQDALHAANQGDEVHVAGGIYKPDQDEAGHVAPGDRLATFQLVSGVSLVGGYAGYGAGDPDARDIELYVTILSGDIGIVDDNSDNSYHLVTGSGTDTTAVIDGFTITGGNANGSSPDDRGAGMYNNAGSPTVTNCTFSGNWAGGSGGGMRNESSSPILTNCTFSGNWADIEGGGMVNDNSSSPTVRNCIFSGNTAHVEGGGMYNERSSPILTNCTFSGNWAQWVGGGMYNAISSPILTNCTFTENSGAFGGGMFNNQSNPALTNCTFSANSATYGGGIFNLASDPVISNCAFTGNSAASWGGGLYNHRSSPAVTNCTFSGNSAGSGGGICSNRSSTTVTNCILWTNTGGQIFNVNGGITSVTFSDVLGGYAGTGNINADPLFVDADGADDTIDDFWVDGDYRLQAGSPCIDAGDNAVVSASADLDGNPRIIDGDEDGVATVDMGAYEFQGPIAIAAHLDIKPGACPNPVNPKSQGVVPVALVGDESFDVADVDIDSLVLRRTDGVGEAVIPIARRGRPRVAIEDVATPFAGEYCDCHEMGGDGIDDLAIKFSTPEMVAAFDLDDRPRRGSIALTLTGTLLDGTVFEASDCVVIVGQPNRADNGRRLGRTHGKP